MRFAMVECDTWDEATNPDFIDLSSDAKVVFFWAWQNPRATICALYTVSLRQVSRALGRARERDTLRQLVDRAEKALDELAAKPFVAYDFDNEVIWVVNRAQHAAISPNAKAGIRREVDRCPPSPLRDEFIMKYGNLLEIGGSDGA